MPEFRPRPLPATPQCPLDSCRQAVGVGQPGPQGSCGRLPRRESCKNMLEQTLKRRGSLPSLGSVMSSLGGGGSAPFSLQIANWSAEGLSDSSKVMWHLSGRSGT